MSNDRREEFWERLEDVRAGMLEIGGAFLPMSHNVEPEDGNLWFITATGTQMAEAAAKGAETRYIVSDTAQGLHTEIKGRIEISTDRKKLDEVWNAVASSWFEEGKDDPDLVLIRLVPASAEVWLGPESGMQFLYKLVKSKVSGEKPDYGEQFSLTFS
ncbi:pyridoxamine 5'-phosphate oxidase family protein [Paracoccus sulfuroxidans]|uniref:General stress protein 26 n=1 Tax=Paracoccus sulfuroxidans TaxID=384678 RepID=A0A562N7Z1_9RHOB|nr:pyridoxamine 5'-phosphate oxidase family protein [Paracoccus sulfuroxidans]TWI28247.1 general stress protein 26 [Paracoccus sulfuroxidans]